MKKKALKEKNCSKTTTSTRHATIKHGDSLTNRTPRNNNKQQQINYKQQFKSIPIVPCKDIQLLQRPSEDKFFQNHTTNPIQTMLSFQQSELGLLSSTSDRNNQSGSKVSLQSKLQHSTKLPMKSKVKSNFMEKKTTIKSQNLGLIYERAKLILAQYKFREEEWKKQKHRLVKELEKCKTMHKKRKNSAHTLSFKNTLF